MQLAYLLHFTMFVNLKKTNNVIHVSLLTFIICQIEYVICIIVIYVIVNVAVGNDRLESNQI